MSLKKSTLMPFWAFLLACILYANALEGEFIWDDHVLVVQNPSIKHWRDLPDLFSRPFFASSVHEAYLREEDYYRPIVLLSFLFDYSLFSLKPWGYHGTNLFLHGINAMLVFFLLKRLFGEKIIALVASLLFSAHPLQSDVVTYISGRTDSVAFFFGLLCLLLHLKARESQGLRKLGIALVGYGCFLLALLSKESALAFLFLIGAMEALPFKSRPREIFLSLVPYVLLTTGYLVLYRQVLSFTPTLLGEEWPFRFLSAFQGVTLYEQLLLLPIHQHKERFLPMVQSLMNFNALFAFFLTMVLILLALARTHSRASYALLWFFLALLPVSNIVPIYPSQKFLFVSEQFLYVPSLGPFILLGLGLERAFKGQRKRLFKALAVALLFCLSLLTIRRNTDWKEEETFYKKTLLYSPQSARIHNNLGLVYERKAKDLEAIKEYQEALSLNPHYSIASYNLGRLYERREELDLALTAYEKALEAMPNWAQAHFGLGNVYLGMGKDDLAIRYYLKALELQPSFAQAHHNLSLAYLNKRWLVKAQEEVNKALQQEPTSPAYHVTLSLIYEEMGKKEEAEASMERARALSQGPL